jgi:hypothetical protein
MKQTKQNAPQHFHARHFTDSSPIEGSTLIYNEQTDKRSKAGEQNPRECGKDIYA